MNKTVQAVWEELAFRNFELWLVHQSGTVLVILVEGYLSNIRMKLKWNRPKGIGEVAFKDFSIFSSGGQLVYRSGMVIAILVGGLLGMIPVKLETQWPKVLGGDSN